MQESLDEIFEIFYDDIFNTTEGELGKKITVLEENRQQLARQMNVDSVDNSPRLATEVYLGDEINREIAYRLFLCGLLLGFRVRTALMDDEREQDQKETPPQAK